MVSPKKSFEESRPYKIMYQHLQKKKKCISNLPNTNHPNQYHNPLLNRFLGQKNLKEKKEML